MLDLSKADRERLTSSVYSIGGFSVSAGDIAARVKGAFDGAVITYEPDAARAKIVGSWPEDVNDDRARADWGWKPSYDWDRAFDEYLVPSVKARYAREK